jgi:hypothetical protein
MESYITSYVNSGWAARLVPTHVTKRRGAFADDGTFPQYVLTNAVLSINPPAVPTRNSISSNCGLATGFLKTRAVRSGRRAPVTFEASRAVINGAVSIVAC